MSPLLEALLNSAMSGQPEVVGERKDDCGCLVCHLRREAVKPESTMGELTRAAEDARIFRALTDNCEVIGADKPENYDKLASTAEANGYVAAARLARLYGEFIVKVRDAAKDIGEERDKAESVLKKESAIPTDGATA